MYLKKKGTEFLPFRFRAESEWQELKWQGIWMAIIPRSIIRLKDAIAQMLAWLDGQTELPPTTACSQCYFPSLLSGLTTASAHDCSRSLTGISYCSRSLLPGADPVYVSGMFAHKDSPFHSGSASCWRKSAAAADREQYRLMEGRSSEKVKGRAYRHQHRPDAV